MSEQKRRPGRPKGSRNKVNIQADVTRALNSGKSITDLKTFLDEYLDELSRDTEHDPKVIIALVRECISLTKYLHNIELTQLSGEGDGGKTQGDDGETPSGEIVPFKFGKKTQEG